MCAAKHYTYILQSEAITMWKINHFNFVKVSQKLREINFHVIITLPHGKLISRILLGLISQCEKFIIRCERSEHLLITEGGGENSHWKCHKKFKKNKIKFYLLLELEYSRFQPLEMSHKTLKKFYCCVSPKCTPKQPLEMSQKIQEK